MTDLVLTEPLHDAQSEFSARPNLWTDLTFLFDPTTFCDLRNGRGATLVGNAAASSGDHGLAVNVGAAGDSIEWAADQHQYGCAFGESMALFVAVNITGTTGGDPGLITHRTSFSDGFWELYTPNTDDVKFGWLVGGSFNGTTWVGAWPGTGFHTFFLTWKDVGSTRDAELWVDGVSKGVESEGENPELGAQKLALGTLEAGASDNHVFGDYYAAALWKPRTTPASGQSPHPIWDGDVTAKLLHENPLVLLQRFDDVPMFAFDAVAAGGGANKTLSLDAAVQAQLTLSASLDAGLQAERTIGADLEAAIARARTNTAEIEAVLEAVLSAGVSINAAVQIAATISASLDANLSSSSAAALDLDAALQAARSGEASLDAFLSSGAATTATVAIGAALQAARSGTTSLEGAVQAARSLSLFADAVLARGGTATAAVDAVLAALGTVEVGLQAILQGAGSASAALDARIIAAAGQLRAAAGRTKSVKGRNASSVKGRNVFTVDEV